MKTSELEEIKESIEKKIGRKLSGTQFALLLGYAGRKNAAKRKATKRQTAYIIFWQALQRPYVSARFAEQADRLREMSAAELKKNIKKFAKKA